MTASTSQETGHSVVIYEKKENPSGIQFTKFNDNLFEVLVINGEGSIWTVLNCTYEEFDDLINELITIRDYKP